MLFFFLKLGAKLALGFWVFIIICSICVCMNAPLGSKTAWIRVGIWILEYFDAVLSGDYVKITLFGLWKLCSIRPYALMQAISSYLYAVLHKH